MRSDNGAYYVNICNAMCSLHITYARYVILLISSNAYRLLDKLSWTT